MIRYLREKCSFYRQRAQWFVVHRVLHVDDPPYPLAMGAAVGMFVTFTPTIGLQMVINVFLAWVMRANKLIGVPIVWISNPVTFVPIYYPLYRLGVWLTGTPSVGKEWWIKVSDPPADVVGWWPTVTHYWDALMDVAVPLWVGCLVFATLTAVPTFFTVYYGVRAYRLRKWGSLVPPETPKPVLEKSEPSDTPDPS